jgi:hypothetical protein
MEINAAVPEEMHDVGAQLALEELLVERLGLADDGRVERLPAPDRAADFIGE